MGFGCTAELTRTLYAVAGEVAPRAADAAGSLADITGLRTRIDETDAVAQVPAVHAGRAGHRRAGRLPPVPPARPRAPPLRTEGSSRPARLAGAVSGVAPRLRR